MPPKKATLPKGPKGHGKQGAGAALVDMRGEGEDEEDDAEEEEGGSDGEGDISEALIKALSSARVMLALRKALTTHITEEVEKAAKIKLAPFSAALEKATKSAKQANITCSKLTKDNEALSTVNTDLQVRLNDLET
jgi:hypothetical protein